MKDAFGAPQSLLVLGGTSQIALATARRLIALRTRTVWLAGRPSPALETAAAGLRARGAEVRTVAFDALDPESHETVLGKVFAEGDIDLVMMAFGIPGDQTRDEEEPLRAVRVARTNYTGAVSAGLVCAGALQAQGHGSLVVLSSVSGERVRRADFIYGSSKAGLDAFAQGLGDALHGTGVRVMIVRPGPVRPGSVHPGSVHPGSVRGDGAEPDGTDGAAAVTGVVDPAELVRRRLMTTPEAVADAIVTGLRQGTGTVWVPGALRVVMSALRHVPRPLFRRLSV
ncbi:SDR family NAD(P)-dependent oxidoreductase [Streptomyces sp. NBC_00654]|uniref:SDR family NAD(P)-dependent oxidoreductase n=1 Tax=Streptomyces sp. NBC_00654 TaxID=2975799 RepID=UPI0022593452|nr:SDR family NAD(P)-dependent oxidoreductase [Streptomyces sp. NBC_00654]MCX4964366.1 SDR family NAD(P)-dependent oxidoreductase [Streptomyces sp. NBC_00654]